MRAMRTDRDAGSQANHVGAEAAAPGQGKRMSRTAHWIEQPCSGMKCLCANRLERDFDARLTKNPAQRNRKPDASA